MPDHKAKKNLVMTASGAYNLWDELILKEEVQFIQKHYGSNVEITIFTYDPASAILRDPSIKFAYYFPSNIGKKFFANIGYFFKNIWLIAHADVLIIGGGGIIFDNEPGVSFGMLMFQWMLRIKTARISGTTLLFWGISLEVNQVANKMSLKKLFVPGDFILVRDERSKWLLDALEIPSTQIQDIVFLYQPPEVPKLALPKKRVGISVRGGFLEANESVVGEMYDKLIELNYAPIFLVFSTAGEDAQNDTLFIRRVMAGKTYNTTKNITQTLDLFPFLHAVIGMRFHAGVLACVHEIPYIPISYGPKTDELVKALEIEHLTIRPHDLTLEIFENIWHTLENSYDRSKERMHEKHLFLTEHLITNLENL